MTIAMSMAGMKLMKIQNLHEHILLEKQILCSMGFGYQNCVVLGCPNSGQRLGKWAAMNSELHGCNNGASMCDAPFKLFPFPTGKKNPER